MTMMTDRKDMKLFMIPSWEGSSKLGIDLQKEFEESGYTIFVVNKGKR